MSHTKITLFVYKYVSLSIECILYLNWYVYVLYKNNFVCIYICLVVSFIIVGYKYSRYDFYLCICVCFI
jgi:hypothetical protein